MTEEKRGKLEYAHRFALDHIRDESRGYWTKVAALLTVNSLLVAGFALLYESLFVNGTITTSRPIATDLLLAIAASGIAIQAMWFWFTIQSYAHFKALYKLVSKYEEEIENIDTDVEMNVSRPWYKFAEYRNKYIIIPENPAAAIVVVVFAGIFMAIWLNALKLLDYNSLIHLKVPLGFVVCSILISLYILLFRIWRIQEKLKK